MESLDVETSSGNNWICGLRVDRGWHRKGTPEPRASEESQGRQDSGKTNRRTLALVIITTLFSFIVLWDYNLIGFNHSSCIISSDYCMYYRLRYVWSLLPAVGPLRRAVIPTAGPGMCSAVAGTWWARRLQKRLMWFMLSFTYQSFPSLFREAQSSLPLTFHNSSLFPSTRVTSSLVVMTTSS